MEQKSSPSWKKRGKNKVTQDNGKYLFYSYYRKNTVGKKLERKKFDAFMNDIITSLTDAMINEGLEIKIPVLGSFRVREKEMKLLDNDGNINKYLKVDWKSSWEYWRMTYPDLSDDDIIKIKDKKLIRFDNAHTNHYFYKIIWDKRRCLLRNQFVYSFKPTRLLLKQLADVVKDENKTVYYYG